MRRYDYDVGYGRRGRRRLWARRYPGGMMANAPLYSWGAWGGLLDWPPYPVPRYGYRYAPPRPSPRESPAYGRAADRLVRQWARRYGYDIEMGIRPNEWSDFERRNWW